MLFKIGSQTTKGSIVNVGSEIEIETQIKYGRGQPEEILNYRNRKSVEELFFVINKEDGKTVIGNNKW